MKLIHPLILVAFFALVPFFALGCTSGEPPSPSSILLFQGTGTSPNSVAAVARILTASQQKYTIVNSDQLNAMTKPDLLKYRLLIVPGGNYVTMGKHLDQSTTTNVHEAVHEGLNYLGICAGGLLAGNQESNSFHLSGKVRFPFYAEVNRGIHKAAVPITFPDHSIQDHYWEDGPHFAGWGDVIGKYPDGTSAIVEAKAGKGWVILTGIHPEAPATWRKGMNFSTPASETNRFAAELIQAALNGTVIPHDNERKQDR